MTPFRWLAPLTLGTALLLALPVGAGAAPVAVPGRVPAATSSSDPAAGAEVRRPPHRVVLERGRGNIAGPGTGRWRRSIDVLAVTYETSWDRGTRVFTADYRLRDLTAFATSGHLQSVVLDFGMRRDLPYDHFVSAAVGNDGSFTSTVQRDGEDPTG